MPWNINPKYATLSTIIKFNIFEEDTLINLSLIVSNTQAVEISVNIKHLMSLIR